MVNVNVKLSQSDEVGKLRKTLELERLARKEQRASLPAGPMAQDSSEQETPSEPQPTLARKTSMKDGTWKSFGQLDKTEQSVQEPNVTQEVCFYDSNHENSNHEEPQTPKQSQNTRPKSSGGEYSRRHSEPPVPVARRRSRSLGKASAFILPDVSMRISGIASQLPPELSQARDDFTQNRDHETRNCTFCMGVIKRGINHEHSGTAKENITIPKPIPVSERMPEAIQYEEEPTIRPSQPPAIALATVLKGLTDEHSHLIVQYNHYKSFYVRHDPSMMRTKRKDLWEKMSTMLDATEAKADQIYALYDVLEGQKQNGNVDLEDKEIEETLQSAGIDLVELGLRGGAGSARGQKSEPAQRQPWDLESNENTTQDLPWEGIESTVETSKTGQAGSRRRSWAA